MNQLGSSGKNLPSHIARRIYAKDFQRYPFQKIFTPYHQHSDTTYLRKRADKHVLGVNLSTRHCHYNKFYLVNPILQDCLDCLKHTLLLDKIEVFLNKSVQARDIIKVFTPNLRCRENAVSYFLCITGSPKILQQVHDFL